jgi:hypothetical protein
MRMLALIITGLWLATAGSARAHIADGTAVLTAAAEVPTPVGVPAAAGGTATLTLEDDNTLVYEVTVHDLSSAVLFGHIHEGLPGVAGGIIFTFTKTGDTTFMGTTAALTADQKTKLLSGAYYANVHTMNNPSGEVRGQIFKPACTCKAASKKEFRSCVNGEIKKLEKEQKKSAEVKAFKKALKKSACGLTAVPKKKQLACCLTTQASYIVTGKMCAPVKKDSQCAALGGTIATGKTCLPNPCTPPASPSGAFID